MHGIFTVIKSALVFGGITVISVVIICVCAVVSFVADAHEDEQES